MNTLFIRIILFTISLRHRATNYSTAYKIHVFSHNFVVIKIAVINVNQRAKNRTIWRLINLLCLERFIFFFHTTIWAKTYRSHSLGIFVSFLPHHF